MWKIAVFPNFFFYNFFHGGLLQLGPVPPDPALPVDHERSPDPVPVLRPPDGALPEPPGRAQGGAHQRDGGAQLLLQGRLRQDVCHGKHHVSIIIIKKGSLWEMARYISSPPPIIKTTYIMGSEMVFCLPFPIIKKEKWVVPSPSGLLWTVRWCFTFTCP